MVIGIGININENRNDFPEEIMNSSTSLSIEAGHSNQRELVCAIITTFLENLFEDLQSSIPLWENYCSHLGNKVTFKYNDADHTGIFKGLNKKGHALIDIENETRSFQSIILK